MKELTIEQAIDQLSTVGQRIGMKAKVQAWYVGGRENVQPIDTMAVTDVSEGRFNQTSERTAVLKITL